MNASEAIRQAQMQWVASDYDGWQSPPVDYWQACRILQGRRLNRALLLLGISEDDREAACYRRDRTGKDWRECVPVC